MARRNRKKKRRVGVTVLPAPFAAAVPLLAVLALGYVWMNCRQESLGREIKALEDANGELRTKYEDAESRWASMTAPCSLEAHLARLHIDMDWPRTEQLVQLTHADVYRQEPPSGLDIGSAYALIGRSRRNE